MYQLKTNEISKFATKKVTVDNINNALVRNIYLKEDLKVKNNKLLFYNDTIFLSELCCNHTCLIFRFSLFNCSMCVNSVLEKIKDIFPNYKDNTKIVFMYDSVNGRITENMFGKMPYMSLKEDILGIPMEKINIPYMFILDSTLVVKQFFVPEKSMPELTDTYLNIIKARYFSK